MKPLTRQIAHSIPLPDTGNAISNWEMPFCRRCVWSGFSLAALLVCDRDGAFCFFAGLGQGGSRSGGGGKGGNIFAG